MKIISSLITAAALLATSVSICAQSVIYRIDFDANRSSWSQGENIANSSFSYHPGSNSDGVGGSTAFSYQWDATGASGELSAKVTAKKDDRINDATTADLSRITLNFSVIAGGLLKTTDTFRVAIQLGASKSNLIDFNVTKDSFSNVSLPLSRFTFETSPSLSEINSGLIVTFEQWGSADNKWGYDAGNSLVLDDIVVLETAP
jgi:hypothetical protein